MREKMIYLLLSILLVLFTGCTNADADRSADSPTSEQMVNASQENTMDDTMEASTGYPAGTIQRSFIMVNNRLFVDSIYSADDRVSQIPDSFINIGEVTVNNIYEMPSADFEASWIEEGTPVCANPDAYSILYIPVADDLYELYEPYIPDED